MGFSIQTDHVIEAQRPDLVVVDKKERSCKIIDFAVSGDSRIPEEKDKMENYQDLERELQLKQIGITVGTAQVQKTVLLGTA